MINYVNNAFDKTLKPCDAQQFMRLTQSEQTEKLITLHRTGDPRAKAKLPALTYMGVLDEEKYNQYLKTHPDPLCEGGNSCYPKNSPPSEGRGGDGASGRTRPLGSRRAEFMRPTGLLMLDFDHVGASPSPSQGGVTETSLPAIDSPVKLWEYIVSEYRERGAELSDDVALAHITPSGDGLRVVVKRVKGFTIERSQQEWCDYVSLSDIDIAPDAACKDISRLSFAPMAKEILYLNPDLLFAPLPEAGDYPDGMLFSGVQESGVAGVQTIVTTDNKTREAANGHLSELPATPELLNSPKTFETEYDGVSYTDIVSRLEEQLGGRPEHGARNSFIFTMACNLRYICNDDAAWIASILPTYGEEPQKHRMTIHSAVNRPMSRTMPETMSRALRVARQGTDTSHSPLGEREGTPPALPHRLPEPVALLVSRTPGRMRPAVAMAVFPPLAAHLCGTEFVYVDNRSYEATFMTLLMAELSSGKSAVSQPIEYIIADMRARDEVARGREREWREACSATPESKEKPKRPEGLGIQVLTPDMTNAAFVQRLADAKGRFLYTVMDEVELLDALKTNGRAGSVSQILRLAFDCGVYGQERVGGSSVNEQVKVRWNWNASTTIQRGRNYFRNSLTDGTLSRLSLSTIVRDELDWGREIPKYGTYGQAFADALRPYIDCLNVCRGVIHSPEALRWAEAMIDEQVSFAERCDDRAYAQLSFRAVLMGFLRGMVLYVMNGMRWTDEIGELAAWSVRYDMWCKMRFFGDLLHQGLEAEAAAVQSNCTRNLLELLPATFSWQMAQEMRMAQGRKPNPSGMLRQWLHRGFIARGENEMYYKLGLSS